MFKAAKTIVLGGCHVTGYKVGEEHSFVQHLKQTYGWNIANVDNTVSFKRLQKLLPARIEEFQPEIVVLQLGNFEFNASARQLVKAFQRPKKDQSSGSPGSSSSSMPSSLYSGQKVIHPLLQIPHLFLVPFFFLFWYIGAQASTLSWSNEFPELYKDIHFVILAPFPCSKGIDNIMRRFGGFRIGQKVKRVNNVTFIQSYDAIRRGKEMFIDDIHLNEKGHKQLAAFIDRAMNGVMTAEPAIQ